MKRSKIYAKFLFVFVVALLFKVGFTSMNRDHVFLGYSVQHKVFPTLLENHSDSEVIILGDSLAAFNINPLVFNKKAVNLSFYGATFVENYIALEKFLKVASKPTHLVVSNSYNWDYKREYEFGAHFIRTNFYEKNKAIEVLSYTDPLAPLNYYLYKSSLKGISLHQLQSSFINQKKIKGNNQIIQIFATINRGATIFKTPFEKRKALQPYHNQYAKNFSSNIVNDKYLRKILETAQKHQLKVTFIKEPHAFNMLDKLDFEQQRRDHLLSILKEYNASYLELENVELAEADFFDFNHLLESGAKKYTISIKNSLEI